jgi:hypothetical protein
LGGLDAMTDLAARCQLRRRVASIT